MNLAKIEGDEIVIRLPISSLRNCVPIACDKAYGYGNHNLLMSTEEFVKEFVNELNTESENGDTILHEAFDNAIVNAIENGAFGIDGEA